MRTRHNQRVIRARCSDQFKRDIDEFVASTGMDCSHLIRNACQEFMAKTRANAQIMLPLAFKS